MNEMPLTLTGGINIAALIAGAFFIGGLYAKFGATERETKQLRRNMHNLYNVIAVWALRNDIEVPKWDEES